MRLTMKIPAPENSIFSEEAALGFIGQDTHIFNEERTRSSPAKIISAKVSDDGKTVMLTLEVPDA